MTRFVMNKKDDLVDSALDGMIYASPWENLVRLAVAPRIRIVMRKDWKKQQVALISGGGSGHEPAHVGFIGKGMLTAAVCGDVFASPSVDAVYNAIINLTGEAGCLLIVKNYTGDRLNFGLAAEKARKAGFKVNMVIVGDDVALPENPQPRGVAGTLLVHKVAGFVAERGDDLAAVTGAAESASQAISTMGVALSSCHLPDEQTAQRVPEGSVEMGLGIHGEPGVDVLKTQNSEQIVQHLLEKVMQKGDAQQPRALLVNNLGGMSALEMSLVTRDLIASPLSQQVNYLIGPAPLMTALDMKGFSVTSMILTPLFEQAICAPVEVTGWVNAVRLSALQPVTAKKQVTEHPATPSENPAVARIVNILCETLIAYESELNQLDAQVGDGDTGSTFAAGARQIQRECADNQLPLNALPDLLAVTGERLATVMGGSSGVLMAIFFTAAAQQLAAGEALPSALQQGLEKMKQYGGAQLGDRTLIDALQPAIEAMVAGKSLAEVAEAAQQGSEATASMGQAKAGRSSYLNSDNLNGVPDPGAVAVARVFAALSNG
ncbi:MULTISPECIES: dihydroxyacetone kinase subunit DhaK [Pantoea]|uniref:Dihydroxyacetone kinase subunit DhaK n=1 Tax=Pantoea brenneri TaxID=472694 RepID=A0A7Y6NF36_9GAMM|nr:MULTISPECIES: dihydroxyacetone kinase subunit DhaK [Pantoea]MBZ6395997.1 dihydroxyacetone kinase subunit DhaK [Pantoea sp.]MBZ6439514.1 dihydroxyacetone kinase subunit DhaK [Pantoea sp.]NUY42348.1 dihydroxyacetone kinase subunit DhaK [Pantoea brenneri]NUY49955.1 dihydroxyacetone kinase subunit DhaK [Pantoea brenneri]NUY60247.1 dihydroxyacetone kinase subunit DhaK [Pantoea brenneri]